MTKRLSPRALEAIGSSTSGTKLLSKNIRIRDRRTSIRLEPQMWDALFQVADFEDCSVHDLCTGLHEAKNEESSFTSTLRTFLLDYYRDLALDKPL